MRKDRLINYDEIPAWRIKCKCGHVKARHGTVFVGVDDWENDSCYDCNCKEFRKAGE